ESGQKVAGRLGCAHGSAEQVSACLRSRSAAEITGTLVTFGTSTSEAGYNGVSVDGWALPDTPLNIIGRSQHNHVPVVLSTTADEYTTMLGLYGTHAVANDAELRAVLAQQFGEQYADAIQARYPSFEYASPTMALVAALSDGQLVCPMRTAARA